MESMGAIYSAHSIDGQDPLESMHVWTLWSLVFSDLALSVHALTLLLW